MRARIVSIAAVVSALALVGVVGAAPASAVDLHSLAAVGSIDSIAVAYHGTDTRPELHIVGWAGDLNEGGDNGDTLIAGVELYEVGPGGAHTTIAWAESHVFDYPRPDVQRAYPGIGANQGFDVTALAPTTGAQSVCLRYYNLNAWPESASGISCQTVTVPARPPFTATLTGSGELGTPFTLSSTATGGPRSYSWWSGDGSPMFWRAPIAGATAASFTPGVGNIGRDVYGVVTTRLPGLTLEQTPDPKQVISPFRMAPERVASDDRYSTSVAASQKAFPDAATGAPVAYIASGAAFPDALSAGAAAAERHGALLLTPPSGLDSRVAAELVRLHPASIIVVGGPAALSENVVTGLRKLPFASTVKRISGADRFAVSRAVVSDAFGASVPDLYLVTGNAFPDALAAAAAGATTGRPVLLTDGRSGAPDAATTAALQSWKTTHVTIVGGTASVSSGIERSLGQSGITVSRAAGSDRFATAAALAGTLTATHLVYLANGMQFPDALTTAVLEPGRPGPLLLTAGQCAPAVTFTAMIHMAVSSIVLIGGDSAQAYNVARLAC